LDNYELTKEKVENEITIFKENQDFEPSQDEDDTGSMKRFKKQEDGLSNNGEKILIKFERKDIYSIPSKYSHPRNLGSQKRIFREKQKNRIFRVNTVTSRGLKRSFCHFNINTVKPRFLGKTIYPDFAKNSYFSPEKCVSVPEYPVLFETFFFYFEFSLLLPLKGKNNEYLIKFNEYILFS